MYCNIGAEHSIYCKICSIQEEHKVDTPAVLHLFRSTYISTISKWSTKG